MRGRSRSASFILYWRRPAGGRSVPKAPLSHRTPQAHGSGGSAVLSLRDSAAARERYPRREPRASLAVTRGSRDLGAVHPFRRREEMVVDAPLTWTSPSWRGDAVLARLQRRPSKVRRRKPSQARLSSRNELTAPARLIDRHGEDEDDPDEDVLPQRVDVDDGEAVVDGGEEEGA